MDLLGHPELETGMPSRSVEHQHNLLTGTGSDFLGEGSEFDGKQLQVHTGRQMEDGPTRGRVDKTDQVAVLATSDIGTADGRSHQQIPSFLGLQEGCVQDRIKQGQSAVLLHPNPRFEGVPSLCSECSLRSRIQSITGPVARTNA